mgnify:CR=1 FL=1
MQDYQNQICHTTNITTNITNISFTVLCTDVTNHTTNQSTTHHPTTNQTAEMDLYEFYYNLNGVAGTIICSVGLLGNLLNIVTLAAMFSRRQTSTTVFLLVMAVSDTLVLLIYVTYDLSCIAVPSHPLLSVDDVRGLEGTFSYLMFYTWYFPANIFMTSSNWCIVCVMVFRFIAVYFPLRAAQHCSVTRAKIASVLITISSVTLIVPEFLTVHIERNTTTGFIISDTKLFTDNEFNSIYYPLVEVFNSFVPFIVCSLLSIMLVRTLRRAQRSRASLSSSYTAAATAEERGGGSRGSTRSHGSRKRKRNCNEQRRISIMLLGITLWFILCTFPSFLCRLLRPRGDDNQQQSVRGYNWIKLRAVSDLFLLLNHSANFILYALTSHAYRKQLIDMILCRDRKSLDRQRTIAQSISLRTVLTDNNRQ